MILHSVPVDEEAEHLRVLDLETKVDPLRTGLAEDRVDGLLQDLAREAVRVAGLAARFHGEERDLCDWCHGLRERNAYGGMVREMIPIYNLTTVGVNMSIHVGRAGLKTSEDEMRKGGMT